jgi:hypothetical protein
MANRWFTQFFYTLHKKPVLLDCNFIVDSANGNGLGIRSLKGPGIASVFMHTSSTPMSGNPNPESGIIIVNLSDNYNRYLAGFSGQASPLSGSNLVMSVATLTVGAPYVITSLGSTTTAQWNTAGVPSTITPAVGVAFIAASATNSGSGTVQAPLSTGSGIDHIEVIGDPNTMNSNSAGGMQLILACFKNTALTAPTDGSVIGLSFEMNASYATGGQAG